MKYRADTSKDEGPAVASGRAFKGQTQNYKRDFERADVQGQVAEPMTLRRFPALCLAQSIEGGQP
jgi:hypothetical protein